MSVYIISSIWFVDVGPKGDFQKFLDGLADADDVPSYVKEHSLIGQPAITSSHPDWNYYAKIIVRFAGINKEAS